MKYQANPVTVEAHRITEVGPPLIGMLPETEENLQLHASRRLTLENGSKVTAGPAMLSRINVEPGDYWVIQEDGYTYLNPKTVFERKYSPMSTGFAVGDTVSIEGLGTRTISAIATGENLEHD